MVDDKYIICAMDQNEPTGKIRLLLRLFFTCLHVDKNSLFSSMTHFFLSNPLVLRLMQNSFPQNKLNLYVLV